MLANTKQILQSTGLLEKLSTKDSEEKIQELADKLEDRLLVAVANNIPDDKANGFADLLESREGDLENYLTEAIPNYQEILRQEIDNFVKEEVKNI